MENNRHLLYFLFSSHCGSSPGQTTDIWKLLDLDLSSGSGRDCYALNWPSVGEKGHVTLR